MQFYVVRHPGVGMSETRVSDKPLLHEKESLPPHYLNFTYTDIFSVLRPRAPHQ